MITILLNVQIDGEKYSFDYNTALKKNNHYDASGD